MIIMRPSFTRLERRDFQAAPTMYAADRFDQMMM
jgi:hypothetical protein